MAKNQFHLPKAPARPDLKILDSIVRRVQAHAMTMIYLANARDDVEKGDPKIGGHPSACSSALHLLSALHMVVKNPQDHIAVKPHASPTDHANNYLMRLFAEADGSRMSDERARQSMKNLRHFSHKGEPVFQSYHSDFDPDRWNFFPSGSVGIPPVNAVYLAHALQLAHVKEFAIPTTPHFWCLMGDSEYREGSLMEVLPEVSERGIGNVTWIVDYNRQSLDGDRILNEDALGGKDNDRIEKTAAASGWNVVQLRHGSFRNKIFGASSQGEALKHVIETAISDYEFQALLFKNDAKTTLEAFARYDKGAEQALRSLDEKQMRTFLHDLGGHDLPTIIDAFETSKGDPEQPTMIVAHTVKGWNLRCAAQSTNHSAMLEEDEVRELRKNVGLNSADLFSFEHFDASSPEGQYLKARGEWLWNGIQTCQEQKKQNIENIKVQLKNTNALDKFPTEVGINLKMVPLAHTQWMLGQISAKLSRIADTPLDDAAAQKIGRKPLTEEERRWKVAADLFLTMAPDVATSTNLNAAIDGRIFGPESADFETQYGVKDTKSPDIVPSRKFQSKHLRFDIAEGNAMTAVGSYGKMGDKVGVPFIPMMTVYDFFIKRALDQLFYNCYWNSSFILVGTPAGVTLSPEGAQHAWKSDIQIANMITWEPAYALELDWIITESIRRHLISFVEGKDSPNGNAGRCSVVIRGVTRALEQKEFLARLKKHRRFEGQTDQAILEATRVDCLQGGYYLVDYRGAPGYHPSENVVHIFAMGALVTEALLASDELLKEGIFANVIQVSNSDLLLGPLAEKTQFQHLRKNLGITGDLYINFNKKGASQGNGATVSYPPALYGPSPNDKFSADAVGGAKLLALGGRRIPVVSVHDGEPGLLDNIGSCVGTLQKTLAVKKHSKSGRPSDIYAYHGIDAKSVAKAAREALEESAYTGIYVDAGLAEAAKATLPSAQV